MENTGQNVGPIRSAHIEAVQQFDQARQLGGDAARLAVVEGSTTHHLGDNGDAYDRPQVDLTQAVNDGTLTVVDSGHTPDLDPGDVSNHQKGAK